MRKQLKAKCLCGGVRIDASFDEVDVHACHCDICRRWCGGPFMALNQAQDVSIEGEELVSVYGTSEWGERGFCKRCGTSLFFRTKDGQHFALSAMAVDNLDETMLASQIFIDSKPDWYSLAEETVTMTGAEFMAQFGDEDRAANG